MESEVIRCGWLTKDPMYIAYHDEEWGKPEHDNRRLFEMLCLEGQQAGLSWLTVLKKRDNYRNRFCNFNPKKIAELNTEYLNGLLNDTRIIRHKGKIEAIVNNAKCYISMEQRGVELSSFLWEFVNNKPVINKWKDWKEIPAENQISQSMSKALKKLGFKFIGSTTCYSLMQACGLVNDHVQTCICYNKYLS